MSNPLSAVSGKVVAVTGASSGIGEATARHLAVLGARVVLGARRTDRLASIVKEIEAVGGQARWIALDVTDRGQFEAFVASAQEAFGRLDVLVSNAGVMPLSPLARREVDAWDRAIDVNLKGVLYGIAAALPVFESQSRGHFVHVTSIADRWVGPTSAVYSATKHAVRALSEGLRQEVGDAVRVTVVAPGATESELADSITDPATRQAVIEQFRGKLLPAGAIARAISYAIEQPDEVDVNEVIVRPTAQVY